MAAADGRSPEQIRQEIDAERDRLATSVESLREELGEATNVGAKLRANLPVVAAGAAGTGFFLAGGIGATMRFFARRSREGSTRARAGRFRLVERD